MISLQKKFALPVFLVCVFLAAASDAQERVLQRVTNLIQNAECIAVGKVESRRCELFQERGEIYTILTMKVTENLVGAPNEETIHVAHQGGVAGGKIQIVTDEPTFTLGEEVVLFLRRAQFDGSSCFRVMFEGKLTIATLNGARWAIMNDGQVDAYRGSDPLSGIRLEEIRTLVQEVRNHKLGDH